MPPPRDFSDIFVVGWWVGVGGCLSWEISALSMMPRRSAQETSFRRLREDEEEERLIRQQVEEERALQESQHDLLDRIRQYQYQADEADAALHLYAGGTNNVVSKTVSRPAHFAAFSPMAAAKVSKEDETLSLQEEAYRPS